MTETERLAAELSVVEAAARLHRAERELYALVRDLARTRRFSLAESASILRVSRATLARRVATRAGQGSPQATP